MNPVGKALWFIEGHFAAELTLEEIAGVSGASRYYLTRAFAAATGRSIMRYVRARRLTEAAQALQGALQEVPREPDGPGLQPELRQLSERPVLDEALPRRHPASAVRAKVAEPRPADADARAFRVPSCACRGASTSHRCEPSGT